MLEVVDTEPVLVAEIISSIEFQISLLLFVALAGYYIYSPLE